MNVIMSSKDKSVHNEIQISMHTCRSLMSDALQGAFAVIQAISHSDISYIIRKGKTEKNDEEKKNENFESAADDGCQLYDGV